MKVLHVSYADRLGGAAIAAYRLHHALLAAQVNSRMVVIRKVSNDASVDAPLGRVGALRVRIAHQVAKQIFRFTTKHDGQVRSINFVRSGLGSYLNRTDADIVHLHWVGAETLSIGEIGQISKPLVWTLHDMWPMCGAEHYENFRNPGAFKNGYANIGVTLDIERSTYHRKAERWRHSQFHLICPSKWMERQVSQSSLLGTMQRSIIPNGLNTGTFKPFDRALARSAVGLPLDKQIVLFGAILSTTDVRKGFDLLKAALAKLGGRATTRETELVVFGAAASGANAQDICGFRTRFIGHISEETALALHYSAADVFVAPSRIESFNQTLIEAQACGTPGVAFGNSGASDTLLDGSTGILVPAFDVSALASAIDEVLAWNNSARQRCRAFAEKHFDAVVVAKQHLGVYEEVHSGLHLTRKAWAIERLP